MEGWSREVLLDMGPDAVIPALLGGRQRFEHGGGGEPKQHELRRVGKLLLSETARAAPEHASHQLVGLAHSMDGLRAYDRVGKPFDGDASIPRTHQSNRFRPLVHGHSVPGYPGW